MSATGSDAEQAVAAEQAAAEQAVATSYCDADDMAVGGDKQ